MPNWRTRSITELRQVYRDLIAQIALVALYTVLRSDPADLVHTVVVNGVLDGIDPATGQRASAPTFSMSVGDMYRPCPIMKR